MAELKSPLAVHDFKVGPNGYWGKHGFVEGGNVVRLLVKDAYSSKDAHKEHQVLPPGWVDLGPVPSPKAVEAKPEAKAEGKK